MHWTILFSLTVFFTLSLSSEVSVILQDGEFSSFVDAHDIRLTAQEGFLDFSASQRCVHSFVITTYSAEAASITVSRVSGFDEATQTYTYTEVGSGSVAKGQPTTISLSPSPVCASTWRIIVTGATGNRIFKDISILNERPIIKRAVTCPIDPTQVYPPECSSASDGAKCLSPGTCGCVVDRDCFGNTDYPFCIGGVCEPCTSMATSSQPNADHLACFPRYPGYSNHPTTNDPLPLERAAPLNYYREVCERAVGTDPGGACQRCNQAPLFSGFTFALPASNQGASGTYHCFGIKPNTPICMDSQYYNDSGVPTQYNVSWRGACRPCTHNNLCFRALARTPICNTAPGGGNCLPCATNAQCAGFTGAANCQADGSCFSCRTDADCGTKDGGEKANQAKCNAQSGICVDPFVCTTNPSCVGNGGNNCQANGNCQTCTSNANCGSLDGGEKAGQPVCGAGGICMDCATNAQCIGTGGNNCQKTGQCLTCTSNSQCASLDGGETPNQGFCNTATGICEGPCARNLDCASKPGKNCQVDGSCKSCVTNNDCGATDGGETPGQTQCSAATGICITPFACNSNPSCVGNGGNNCQRDTTCISCTGIATCGAFDGGEVMGQPNCNLGSRQCVNACGVNADCVGTQGNNCNANGICNTCRANSDCGATDGGEIPRQTVCNTITGICETACTQNADCAAKAGKNCQKDGTCFSCTSNANCGTLDGGESPNQLECFAQTGICRDPFQCTTNPSCLGNGGANCQADKSCRTCTSNNDCGTLDGGEIANQPLCNKQTGLCDFCKSNDDCPDSAKNCGADGFCYKCSYAAGGKACGILDGPPNGPHNNQPNCDEKLGICVEGCTLDAHCNATGMDPCYPYCNVDKRCCVECWSNTHCPHATWRPDYMAARTVCSMSSWQCIPGCTTDSDCGADTPACATSLGICVECVYNSHCTDVKGRNYCNPIELSCTGTNGWTDNSLSGGAVAAIVIGCVAGVLLIIIVTLFLASIMGKN